MKHPCEIIYNIATENANYGDTPGKCRITGKPAIGLKFEKWVKPTFTDHGSLLPGDIISNEALFCFDEASQFLARKTGKDKPQRFRNYSHIVADGVWYCLTKGDKKQIYELILQQPQIVCLAESGQKHILFKHRPGFWQLEDLHIAPNIALFSELHKAMCELNTLGFTQAEIISGKYYPNNLKKIGMHPWRSIEQFLGKYRGSDLFYFTSFMIFKND